MQIIATFLYFNWGQHNNHFIHQVFLFLEIAIKVNIISEKGNITGLKKWNKQIYYHIPEYEKEKTSLYLLQMHYKAYLVKSVLICDGTGS